MVRREVVLPSIDWVFATHRSSIASGPTELEQFPILSKCRVEPSSPRAHGRYEPYLWAYALKTRPKHHRRIRRQDRLPSISFTNDASSEMTGNPSTIHAKRPSTDTQYTTFDTLADIDPETGGEGDMVAATLGFWGTVKAFLVALILNIRRTLDCHSTNEVISC